VDNTISRQHQTEERLPEMEDKMEELLHTNNHKEKNEHNIQELSDTTKRPNLRIHGMEEGPEIQTKGLGNLLNEIIAENFPNLCSKSYTRGISNANKHE
jgi:TolA-binding protein